MWLEKMLGWYDMRRTQLTIAGFEDGGKGQEPRNAGSLQKPENEKKELFPQSLQNQGSPANTKNLAEGDLFKIPDLQNCGIINLYSLSY